MRGVTRGSLFYKAAVALCAVFILAASSGGSTGVTWSDEPICDFPPGSAYGGFRSDDPGYQDWLREPGVAEALEGVVSAIEELEGGVGWFTDHIEEQVVVTVDPSETSRPNELIEQVEASAGGIVDVVIRPACYPRGELEEVATAISRRDWHPEPRLQVWEISPIGRVLVGLCEPADEQARILTEEHGHRVDLRLVECGSVESATDETQGQAGGEPQTTTTTAIEPSVPDRALEPIPQSEATSGSEQGSTGIQDEAGSEGDVGRGVPSWMANVGLVVAVGVGLGLLAGAIWGRLR